MGDYRKRFVKVTEIEGRVNAEWFSDGIQVAIKGVMSGGVLPLRYGAADFAPEEALPKERDCDGKGGTFRVTIEFWPEERAK